MNNINDIMDVFDGPDQEVVDMKRDIALAKRVQVTAERINSREFPRLKRIEAGDKHGPESK